MAKKNTQDPAYLASVRRKLEGLLAANPKGPRAEIYKKGLNTVKSQQAHIGR
jgi:hypothetical protein